MASTFEQCELWPINEESYTKYHDSFVEKSAAKAKEASSK